MVKIWPIAVTGWLGCVIGIAVSINPTFAQLTPDNSLGKERSQVIPLNTNNDRIEGGAARGANLFHSFQDFNVGEGRGVYFANPEGITNIFSRVTGGNSSNIFGKLGVLGNANLFFLNPNGIVFGKNAQLDMQGSFVGTTASSVKFADGREFSATTPQNTPLLTISVPVGLQFGVNPGKITVQGSGHNLTYNPSTAGTIRTDVPGLQVQPGKTLALVGGDINLEGGNLRAESGRIELGSIVSPSLVSLTQNDSGLFLEYSGVNAFGNIQLSQKASVDVSGEGGGSIQVQAEKLSVRDGASLLSITTGSKPGGEFNVNATESIELIGESADKNYASSLYTESQGAGSSGELNVNTGKLIATDGAYISTYIVSSGNGGNLNVKASDSVELFGRGIFLSGFYTGTSTSSSGNAGNLSVEARSLAISGGALLFASSPGEGNAGDITVNAQTINLSNQGTISSVKSGQGNAGSISIKVQDTLSLTNGSRLSNFTVPETVGNGGDINIQTGKLFLDNNSYFTASTNGQGNGGNIIIQAADTISIANKSSIFSVVSNTGVGNAGNIRILAKSFSASGESSVFNSNIGGKGNAGDISINTKKNVSFTGGSFLSASTLGEGNGGNIKIQADGAVKFSGRSERLGSGIFSGVLKTGVGNSGDIEIVARSFELSDDADLSTLSNGKGNAGNVLITTLSDTTIKDSSTIATFLTTEGNAGKIAIRAGGDVLISGKSDLSSFLYRNAVGKGGDIEIQGRNFSLTDGAVLNSTTVGKGDAGNVLVNATGNISLTNGASIYAATFGQGNAGNVTVNAGGKFSLQGTTLDGSNFDTGIFSIVGVDAGFTGKGKGKGGNINVTARDLSLNGAALSASSLGNGIAGNININSSAVRLDNKAAITAVTNSSDGGNINLTATDLLLLRRNSNITTTAGLAKSGGDGGNINIDSKFIVASPEENSDISADAYTGSGGRVQINSQGIFGIESRPKPTEKSDITASSQLGISGITNINAPDTSSIQNSFTEASPNVIDTNALIANSCISRSSKQGGTFFITGSGALRNTPGDQLISVYSTGEVRNVEPTSRLWKKGDPIIEAQGVYRLADGQLVLSRECH
ncbi:MAG: filamentous hemagglutinin N-terminal domain-containing protein [Nostoc sp. DedQUE08]|uniref:two-partner secretion domain-containing protein n=1 Tax=Nostoc sp. DedQUE08 TaxID=3075393 RepID=UPI002AD570C4|nr:filamentous hemagglutinin N-terminal domain-containing protein [Nostoc sp. DedQUE08]MDZ8066667.1 filamentous hemagglutinin N-terminal domain-containing protein [Nostoc sp. DedQUE08]